MRYAHINDWHKENRSSSPALPPHSTKKPFEREIELPRLIGLWPSQLTDYSRQGTATIVSLIRKALRVERKRSQSGHWGYDLNRHLALLNALKIEKERLTQLPSDKVPSGDEA